MVSINREPDKAASKNYDIIIVGGGIYGAMLLLEASKRGLRSLLLERDDFGAATSFNSLRILHGGLRYLQKLDLPRFDESVRERRWFMQNYPELARPMPCLMPLYGKGMHRPSILRIALTLNDMLSWRRNRSVREDRHLGSGKVVGPEAVQALFPGVDTAGLQGGAVWYDACIPDSQRVVMEVLRWACALGATALNYVEAGQLKIGPEGVTGVSAYDKLRDGTYNYSARLVINATGPWSRMTAKSLDRDEESLFWPSIAWNILLDRPALSDHALAVMSKKPGAQTYFLHPWNGKILAGTGHRPWSGSPDNPKPTVEQIAEFLQDINEAIPDLNLGEQDILHVFAGLLPAGDRTREALAVREVILDHTEIGGPPGLFSVSGVKFTTSRLVAEKTIQRVLARCDRNVSESRPSDNRRPALQTGWELSADNIGQQHDEYNWKEALARIIAEESVVHLDDLVLRRTTLWEDTKSVIALAPRLCALFDWDEDRCKNETNRLKTALRVLAESKHAGD